jgi:hypothetical protein
MSTRPCAVIVDLLTFGDNVIEMLGFSEQHPLNSIERSRGSAISIAWPTGKPSRYSTRTPRFACYQRAILRTTTSKHADGPPISPLQSMAPLLLCQRLGAAVRQFGDAAKRYILKTTTTSAIAPRPAMNPAMMPAIEYGMGPASARSAFICWRC